MSYIGMWWEVGFFYCSYCYLACTRNRGWKMIIDVEGAFWGKVYEEGASYYCLANN